MGSKKQNIIFSANTDEFDKNIKESTGLIKTLNSELKLNQAQLNGNSTNVETLKSRLELLNSKYEEQTKVVENTRKKYEEAVKIYGENSTEAQNLNKKLLDQQTIQQNLANEINTTTSKLSIQSNTFNIVGKSLQSFGEKVEGIGDKITSVGNSLSKFSAVATAGVVAVTKSAVDFESAFTGVLKTVDGTAEQLDNLRQGILDLSEEVPSSATEIAAVAEAAGQLGIQTDNILDFSKAMIDLGNSTNLTAEEASTQLARFANITQMSQKDFDKLGSAIVDLGNNFATTEADIVEMAMRLAGAGEQVGFSEGQILGLATALSSVGIEAEMGGSAISKAMVKMQNAVELGGTKLNEVLQKTGMSLRSLELMSANDSKGFKELSQSIGMTSTEVKNLITAGTNLEDFAEISGMSAKEFQEAWGKDAAGALSAFIQGLGNAENKGESAISMLTEMGLTEVRLRDSLLRAANAGDLFNKAIETGTSAFEENIALTNEANKRYGTTESQIKKLKNSFQTMAIGLGDELLPAINSLVENAEPLIDNLKSAVKRFNELDDVSKSNIIRMGALAIVIGPVTSGIGSIVSTIGGGISTIGKFSSAIGSISSASATGATEIQALSTGITSLINPTTLAVAGIVGLTAVVTAFCIAEEKETIALNNNRKAIEDDVNQRQALIDKQNEQISANLTEIANTENLYSELKQITDENGKVKDGYEKRAKFIVTELSNALGIEISMTGDIINGYKDLQQEIDNTILKKKAEVIMQQQEEAYTQAIQNRSKAYEDLIELQEQLKDANAKFWSSSGRESVQAKMQMDILSASIKEQNDLINGYADDIANYEYNLQLMQSNTTESLEELVNRNIVAYSSETASREEQLQKQIEITLMEIETNQNKYDTLIRQGDEANATIYQNQILSEENQLNALAESLVNMTTTIGELSPLQIEMWQLLADNSYNTYCTAINQMDPSTAAEIQKVTNTIAINKTVETATGNLGDRAERLFLTNISEMTPDTNITVANIRDAIDTDKTVETASGDMGNKAHRKFLEMSDGTDAGKEYDNGVQRGIEGNQAGAFSAVRSFASSLLSNFMSVLGIHSPSKETAEIAGFFVEGFNVGISKMRSAAENEVADLGLTILDSFSNSLENIPLGLNGNINDLLNNNSDLNDGIINNISPKSIVVNFYPQEMTNEEIDRAAKKIREDWGAEVV